MITKKSKENLREANREVSADQAGGKGDMDVAVSERRRVGRKRQDVADCRPSTPVGASKKGDDQ